MFPGLKLDSKSDGGSFPGTCTLTFAVQVCLFVFSRQTTSFQRVPLVPYSLDLPDLELSLVPFWWQWGSAIANTHTYSLLTFKNIPNSLCEYMVNRCYGIFYPLSVISEDCSQVTGF